MCAWKLQQGVQLFFLNRKISLVSAYVKNCQLTTALNRPNIRLLAVNTALRDDVREPSELLDGKRAKLTDAYCACGSAVECLLK